MIALVIAAVEKRKIASIDIKGAYLNAKMTGEEEWSWTQHSPPWSSNWIHQ
jgi:hypothetical protein